MKAVDKNSLFEGELICYQNKNGYRFSIDSVLLAHFVSVKENDRILDLGTGSGIISLILLYRHYQSIKECSGIELQKSLYELAKKNICENTFTRKNRLFNCDIQNIKDHHSAGTYDTIVCNPPFYPYQSGRVCSNSEARIARHQTSTGLKGFLSGAAHAVKNRGNIYFIYPADLLQELLRDTAPHNLELKTLRFVYSYPGSRKGAQLVLIQCIKNGGPGVQIPEPLYLYNKKNGVYSAEVEQYYQPNEILGNSTQSSHRIC